MSLTAAGLGRLTEVEHLLAGVERRVLSSLSADEQATFYKLLARATTSPTCSEALETSRLCMEAEAENTLE